MFRKFCGCVALDLGCIFISMIGLAMSGIIFVIHEDLWTVISLILSVVSGGFLLLGSIKYIRMALIMYLIVEAIHVTEMFAACIIIFADIIAFRKFKCHWNCHCLWLAVCPSMSSDECEDSSEVCDKIGILLGSAFWIYTLIDIYFLICGFGLLMETHISKSDNDPV